MEISLFDYFLPKELIAQFPLKNRAQSKLMVVIRKEQKIYHSWFRKFPQYLKKNDLLVVNNSKVIPAKLIGSINGSLITCLLVKEIKDGVWEILTKPARKVKIGSKIIFNNFLEGEIIDTKPWGKRIINFWEKNQEILKKIKKIGYAPLPPYIKRTLEERNYKEVDLKRYQTVYAKKNGSIAAPTAGLHFTSEILREIKEKGIEILEITLHIGEATFQPIRVNEVEKHKMEEEKYHISPAVAHKINQAKKDSRRIVAVGTTTVRTLESAYQNGKIQSGFFPTNLFIYPGYNFKVVDALLTNFHLPKSTLLMLVSAFASWNNQINGVTLIKKAYQEAINNKYRFYSYGDCMLIQ
ncbi:MAG: tRNA preQ1(34) S-adenosylmethionine ribosyltransferase-isomerase QueA [Candidatus Aminicenantia bacterium]